MDEGSFCTVDDRVGSALDGVWWWRPPAQTELQAKAQTMVNGMEAELDGRFRIEMKGKRLKAELDNANFAISLCLVKASGSMPLAAPQTVQGMWQDVAEFELNSELGQAVPNVGAGDKLEARQGAMASGMADCGAPLLVSATFQPDVEPSGH